MVMSASLSSREGAVQGDSHQGAADLAPSLEDEVRYLARERLLVEALHVPVHERVQARLRVHLDGMLTIGGGTSEMMKEIIARTAGM
jgi:hypothetical protein